MTAIEARLPWLRGERVGAGLRLLSRRALAPTDVGPLVVLRLAFGLLMAASMVRFMARGWIQELYVAPEFHFTYAGFGWIRPAPEWGLWLVFIALTLLSLCIAFGLAYRTSIISFFLLFTYVELLDKTYYLNHYYFISLLSFLLIFLPLNGAFALDNRLGIAPRRTAVPAWMVWAVRLQLGLVYFFAGLAKINPDWLLEAQPLRIWLRARTGAPLIGALFDHTWVAYAMSWAGMLFDLTIPFWLSWRKSRPVAYLAVIGFHSLTGLLFNIGMFPWIMIGCTMVFFEWRDRQSVFRVACDALRVPNVSRNPQHTIQHGKPGRGRSALPGFLLLFFLVQLVLPLRHWWMPGDVNWTEQGGRFAWRVMLVEKTGHTTFFVKDKASGREWMVLPGDYLTAFQEQQMSFQPDMIMQFAHFIAAQYERSVEVRADVFVSWNGRASRRLLDPAVDLLQSRRPPMLDESTDILWEKQK